MRGYKKAFSIVLMAVMMVGSVSPNVMAWEKRDPNDPFSDQWKAADILLARPLGVVAGILGVGIFILSLPYTLPTGGVDEAAKTFIKRPFAFSFTRPCPDEDM